MTEVTIAVTDEDRAALRRSFDFLSSQAQYLQETASTISLPRVETYASTLKKLSEGPATASISADEVNHLQKARFLLEGARAGFRNADLDDRADKIDNDLERLANLVKAANTERSKRIE